MCVISRHHHIYVLLGEYRSERGENKRRVLVAKGLEGFYGVLTRMRKARLGFVKDGMQRRARWYLFDRIWSRAGLDQSIWNCALHLEGMVSSHRDLVESYTLAKFIISFFERISIIALI